MTLLRPIILIYDFEMWALRKTKELRLEIFKRKVLGKMYGLIFDSQTDEWRIHGCKLQRQFRRIGLTKFPRKN